MKPKQRSKDVTDYPITYCKVFHDSGSGAVVIELHRATGEVHGALEIPLVGAHGLAREIADTASLALDEKEKTNEK